MTFLSGNIVFYFVIGDSHVHKSVMSILAILRVVLLDGLFLVTATILGICIIIVSLGKEEVDLHNPGSFLLFF